MLRLGVKNLGRVALYKLGLRLGLHPVCRLHAAVPAGPFFGPVDASESTLPVGSAWEESALLFGRWQIAISESPPDWLANPMTGKGMVSPEREWWKIPDFDPAVGDIKLIWELSRFDWVIAFAQRAKRGEPGAIDRLNQWLSDWCDKNPPFKGPNWKCGQEASLRVLHLAAASMVMGQAGKPLPALTALIKLHLDRIAPTVGYAMAQDNNHGTSEAAALFVGGHWLTMLGDQAAQRWHAAGRSWLENRATRLIGADGSFSQYSVNYHRLMLDTLSLVERWRELWQLSPFTEHYVERVRAATDWLYRLVDAKSGDAPNVGANDGARILQLTPTSYRDYRPTVQLAMALFQGERAYPAGPHDGALRWLGVELPTESSVPPGSDVGADGGFAVLRRDDVLLMLRYPRFRFRPSQSDALHVDLWVHGQNRLHDGGTFSYNAGDDALAYFGGTASHNTAEFDRRDQMPRLSRFLFGEWLCANRVGPLVEDAEATTFEVEYQDYLRATHAREVRLTDNSLSVRDRVAGMQSRAILRWRLRPGDWRITGSSATDGCDSLRVSADVPIVRFEILEGWESRHYLEKTPLPVLEIEVAQKAEIVTEYQWIT